MSVCFQQLFFVISLQNNDYLSPSTVVMWLLLFLVSCSECFTNKPRSVPEEPRAHASPLKLLHQLCERVCVCVHVCGFCT